MQHSQFIDQKVTIILKNGWRQVNRAWWFMVLQIWRCLPTCASLGALVVIVCGAQKVLIDVSGEVDQLNCFSKNSSHSPTHRWILLTGIPSTSRVISLTGLLAPGVSDDLKELMAVTRHSCCFQLVSILRSPGFSVLMQTLNNFIASIVKLSASRT